MGVSREHVKYACAVFAILLSVVAGTGAADYRATLEAETADPADHGGDAGQCSAGAGGGTGGSSDGTSSSASSEECDTVATTGAS